MTLIDTHCHLDFPEFDADRLQVIARAAARGVNRIVNIGSSLEGSRRSVKLAGEHDCLYATVGIHPHEADSFREAQAKELKELAMERKVVAIGEIGLDYFKNFSRADNQRRLFQSLLALARESSLSLVIHSRDAHKDTISMLKEFMPLKAVVHCFSGGRDFLEDCLGLGLMVSYTCNITYKKAEGLREALKATPLDRLMLETDAPYLSPEGQRGRRNEPANVRELAEFAARLLGVSPEELAEITTRNAREFFKIQ
jgi:TatD DNase family protein